MTEAQRLELEEFMDTLAARFAARRCDDCGGEVFAVSAGEDPIVQPGVIRLTTGQPAKLTTGRRDRNFCINHAFNPGKPS